MHSQLPSSMPDPSLRSRVRAIPSCVVVLALMACTHDPPSPAPATSSAPIAPVAAVASSPRPPEVPEAIRVSAGETLTVKASAQGTQVYECQAGEDAGFAWKLVGPDAVLTDDSGARIGRHYTGPTWEALDGSKVVGVLQKKVDAPAGGAIPWLLLGAKSTEGTGKFAKVTSIQRVDTVGGVPPTGGCDASKAGTKQSTPYRATYYFYAK
jgi:hypothetical protein